MAELTLERSMLSAPQEAVPILSRLRDFFDQRGVDCYVVGGLVRDLLLDRATRDIDLVVAGDALAISREAAREFGCTLVPLDEANQVARMVVAGTLGHWHIDFAALRGGIAQDLGYRDFTINAMAVPLGAMLDGSADDQTIDPLDGRRDLDNKVVRAVAESSLSDDPARLMRAVRLCTTLGFQLSEETAQLARRHSSLVSSVAAERVRDELNLILDTGSAYTSLRRMNELGLLDPLFPELAETKGVSQPKEHFWDVFDHSLETVGRLERILHFHGQEPPDSPLRAISWNSEIGGHFEQRFTAYSSRRGLAKLAALLHDIGKPEAKSFDENGRMRFFGHMQLGAEMTSRIMRRLRYSNRESRMVELMVEHHLRPGFLAREDAPSRRATYRYFRDTGDIGIDTLYLGLADHLAARGPTLDPEEWRKHVETTRYVLSQYFEERSTVEPPKLIDGNVLMKEFGLEPGPRIGELLEVVREAQAEGEVNTREEALELVRKRLEKK